MLFHRYALDKTSSEVDRAETVRLAVVACGPRLEETLAMLKSAVLFSHRTLHFHIFAENELHPGFRDAVSPVLVLLIRCILGNQTRLYLARQLNDSNNSQ